MSAVWTVTPTTTWVSQIRAALDGHADIPGPLDYEGTIDGAWSYVGGKLAYDVSQHIADGVAAMVLATSPRASVVARALDRGLTPRAETYSTLTVELTTGAGGVVPVGTELKVVSGTHTLEDTELGVTLPLNDPESRWEVIENGNAGDLLATSDTVVIQCVTPGRVTAADPSTFAPVIPITGVEVFTWTSPATRTFGRAAERTSELRLRVEASRAGISGTDAGLYAALLELDWVVAAGVTSTPGYVTVSIAPTPPTTADRLALAETIYRHRATGSIPQGSQSQAVTGADGQSVTMYWNEGTEETVTVAFSVTPASGVTQAAADALARDAINVVFAALEPGETLLYLRAIGALDQPEIAAGSVTLNGGTANVVPTVAVNVLTPVYS